jgi:anti-sigma regulatory factor (Ser/Thr protein kinase)
MLWLEAPASLEGVAALQAQAAAALAAAGPVLAGRGELVVEELALNAVQHGGAAGLLRLGIDLEPAACTLVLEDQGGDFDPAAAEARPLQQDDDRIGGLGLLLVQRFAKALRHERIPGGNRTTLRLEA